MKKNVLKSILAVVLCMVMVFGVVACGAKDDTTPSTSQGEEQEEGTEKKEVLKVGLSGDYPPFEFYAETENGRELVGIDVELAKYIADKLGMELELTDMSFDGLIGSLDEGKFDLVISGMTIKEDRKCLFSDPYYVADQALLVKAGNEDKYASLDDLKGEKIGGQMGALQQELAEQYAGDTAQIVTNVQDMVMMVAEGKLDGMFCENGVALSAIAKNSDLAIATLEIPTEKNELGICIQEGNEELLEIINPIVAEVVEKNLVGEWEAKYLDVEEAAAE